MIEVLQDTYKTLFSKLTLSIWAIATLGAVIAGPFGTFETMSVMWRCIYWPLVTTSSILLGYLAHALTRMVFQKEEDNKSRLLAGILGTVFIATDVYLLSRYLDPDRAFSTPYVQFLGWVGFVFFAVIFGRVVLAATIQKETEAKARNAINISLPEASVPGTPLPRLVERLPEQERAEVLRLSANDHFVYVLTESGEHSIRMRLRDAIFEMDGVPGTLVHRSHWVAKKAMLRVIKDQGKAFLMLTNGDRLPVSRNYRADVERLNLSVSSDAEGEQSEVSVQ